MGDCYCAVTSWQRPATRLWDKDCESVAVRRSCWLSPVACQIWQTSPLPAFETGSQNPSRKTVLVPFESCFLLGSLNQIWALLNILSSLARHPVNCTWQRHNEGGSMEASLSSLSLCSVFSQVCSAFRPVEAFRRAFGARAALGFTILRMLIQALCLMMSWTFYYPVTGVGRWPFLSCFVFLRLSSIFLGSCLCGERELNVRETAMQKNVFKLLCALFFPGLPEHFPS